MWRYDKVNTEMDDIMKIVADENLAFTDYFFSEFGEISQHAGRTLTHQDVQDADALLIRSVTNVNQTLIENSALKFIGSATIGTDHLDIAEIEKRNIHWSNASGCNAQAVSEYVITALLHVKPELLDAGQSFTLGVIGLGNVGSRLVSMAKLLNWNVIAYDPFVLKNNVEQVDLENLLKNSDAISIHVPLAKAGDYPTHHMINANTLMQMKSDAILINSARGSVVSETALIQDIQKTSRLVILDVFEHEPEISKELLSLIRIVTPHIAGYSLEGKARGTQMIYNAFCSAFNYKAIKQFETQLPVCEQFFKEQDFKQILKQYLTQIYDIQRDDQNLRACLKNGKVDQKEFDYLRKTYPLRREWAAHGGPKA